MDLRIYQGAVSCGSLLDDDYEPIPHFTLGLVGEAGEVANLVKKSQRSGAQPLNVSKMLDELGDVLWYTTALAFQFGYTLEEIAQINMEKLSERHPAIYPPLSYYK